MFSKVSVCPLGGGAVCSIACWDTYPLCRPPWADTPQADTHPPGQTPHSGRHPSWADTPQTHTPGQTHPLPTQCMLGYGQRAGGTHPTGMQSCKNCEGLSLRAFLLQFLRVMGSCHSSYFGPLLNCTHFIAVTLRDIPLFNVLG